MSEEEKPAGRITRAGGVRGQLATASQPVVVGRPEEGSKFFGDSEVNTVSGSETENTVSISNADRRKDLFGRFLKHSCHGQECGQTRQEEKGG